MATLFTNEPINTGTVPWVIGVPPAGGSLITFVNTLNFATVDVGDSLTLTNPARPTQNGTYEIIGKPGDSIGASVVPANSLAITFIYGTCSNAPCPPYPDGDWGNIEDTDLATATIFNSDSSSSDSSNSSQTSLSTRSSNSSSSSTSTDTSASTNTSSSSTSTSSNTVSSLSSESSSSSSNTFSSESSSSESLSSNTPSSLSSQSLSSSSSSDSSSSDTSLSSKTSTSTSSSESLATSSSSLSSNSTESTSSSSDSSSSSQSVFSTSSQSLSSESSISDSTPSESSQSLSSDSSQSELSESSSSDSSQSDSSESSSSDSSESDESESSSSASSATSLSSEGFSESTSSSSSSLSDSSASTSSQSSVSVFDSLTSSSSSFDDWDPKCKPLEAYALKRPVDTFTRIYERVKLAVLTVDVANAWSVNPISWGDQNRSRCLFGDISGMVTLAGRLPFYQVLFDQSSFAALANNGGDNTVRMRIIGHYMPNRPEIRDEIARHCFYLILRDLRANYHPDDPNAFDNLMYGQDGADVVSASGPGPHGRQMTLDIEVNINYSRDNYGNEGNFE